MAEERLPFLRGRIWRVEDYQSPQGFGGKSMPLPERDPALYGGRLLGQLDAMVQAAAARIGARDDEARREIVAIAPEGGYALETGPLGDKDSDTRVISRDPDTGIVLLDAPGADLAFLRRKVEAYGTRRTPKGAPKNQKGIAPISMIGIATSEDLAGPRLRNSGLGPNEKRWFELGCRGGLRRPAGETQASGRQVRRQLARLGQGPPREFVATEQVVFFVRLTLEELRQLVGAIDCAYEVELAGPGVRDWLMLEDPPIQEIQAFTLAPPAPDAPAVAILDTGVRTIHPLLRGALLSADSVLPTDPSPEDEHGHGTTMAGLVVHGGGLGAALERGGAEAACWIQSLRVLTRPNADMADEQNRSWWPYLTQAAVARAEQVGDHRPRAFVMAVTADPDVPGPSLWRHAVDQLAFAGGEGRLICVSAGNADVNDPVLINGYPQMNLQAKLKEPAPAFNALTVGAFTTRADLPPGRRYAEAVVVAPAGGVSPSTTAGEIGSGPVKPDVVLEGGNVAVSGGLTDAFVSTLCTMTAGLDHLRKPLVEAAQTSEAAARAARLAADVWQAAPDLRPETVRGLVVHAADWTPAMREQFPNVDERLAICGYGVPDEALATACARECATLLVEDEMPNATILEGGKKKRRVKLLRMPFPEGLADLAERRAELRVTLSYFAEPNTFRRREARGLDLKWDLQGPGESDEMFLKRVNKLRRAPNEKANSKGFPWEIGPQRRRRGTVQSDRWEGLASFLAGSKLLAVMPVLGWWDNRPELETASMRFALIVTLRVAGVDIYTPIAQALEVDAVVEIS